MRVTIYRNIGASTVIEGVSQVWTMGEGIQLTDKQRVELYEENIRGFKVEEDEAKLG